MNTYQILTNDDEVCIPSLSSILLAVILDFIGEWQNFVYIFLFIYLLLFFSLVWSQQMQQDTALRLAPEKSSFWSLDFEEPKGLMVDSRLQNTPMLVSSILCSLYWPSRVHLMFEFSGWKFTHKNCVLTFFSFHGKIINVGYQGYKKWA